MAETETGTSLREEITLRVAANVRDALRTERWSARQAAFKLGMTPMYVSRRLSGSTPMDAADLAEFADLVKVDVQDFYRERDDRPRGRAGAGAGGLVYLFGDDAVPPAGFEPAAFCSEGGRSADVIPFPPARAAKFAEVA